MDAIDWCKAVEWEGPKTPAQEWISTSWDPEDCGEEEEKWGTSTLFYSKTQS